MDQETSDIQAEAVNILSKRGLNREVVEAISIIKDEPEWMRDMRLKAYEHFEKMPMPRFGVDLGGLDFQDILYFVRASDRKSNKWEEVPQGIKETFERLGIPEAERKFLAGVATQYESEVIYESLKKQWNELGVVFLDTDSALKAYPEIFKEYFAKVVPYTDNKFACLNTAVWSGGTFIYVPKGVKVRVPLQAYFFINARNMGQFERTLIIADEDSEVTYIEGCTAPMYSTSSLHSAVVEIYAKENSRIRYTTIQNWAGNVFNLVTKRAVADKNAHVEWVDCNLGSKATMKYPAVILKGDRSHGEVLSMAVAGHDQHLDSGAKMIHIGKHTSSIITSKSISKSGGRSSYRGLVKIPRGAKGARAKVTCDALILDGISQSDTYPVNEMSEPFATLEHEASVSKITEAQMQYLTSRGISSEEASSLIVSGFIEPIVKELPMEYALEMNELIRMSMEGSVG